MTRVSGYNASHLLGRTAHDPRVLVLSATYGSGHNQVAHAVSQALVAAGTESACIDHFRTFVHPLFDSVTRALYLAILRAVPGVWGRVYCLSKKLPVRSPLMFGMNRLGKRRLASYLAKTRSRAVVSVHPTPAGAVSALKAKGFPVFHATVFTDFDVHTQWIYPHVERYCVPSEEVAEGLAARGISKERIAVTGIPIRERFFRRLDGRTLRAKYGLREDQPVALVMAGAHPTLGGLTRVLHVLKSLPVDCQGVFVCGRDRVLAERILRDASPSVRVFGYIEAVEELMALSDVLVTKAGAVTLSEAIAMELPMILYRSLPGQEDANQGYLERAGAALTVRGEEDLGRVLLELLTDPALSDKLRANLRRLRRSDPAQAVAREILALTQ